MQNLDGAIINTSLPQMASVFRVRPADLNIGITAYILSTAAFVPLSCWVADRLGAHRVLAVAIVIFALPTLFFCFSQNFSQLYSARILYSLAHALLLASPLRLDVLRGC